MNRISKFSLQFGLALLLLMGLPGAVPHLHAQKADLTKVSKAEKLDAPETNTQLEDFSHSPAVEKLAKRIGVSPELMEGLDSAIMIGAILWFIFRFVPKMYRRRSETLRKQLFDARSATAEASARLAVVEERLSKLGIEIDAIREQTMHDSINDEKRIQESLEAEKQRIVASVEQEIESAGAAARRDLKKYAASLAVDRAMSEIHLSDDDDRALISSFGRNFSNNNHNGERN
jgi:F-type H+-transporting ATPase subunit b